MSYKGELSGFPEHVVELMLKRQVEQGNKEDVTVFEECAGADKMGGGFDWRDTQEGLVFWDDVIEDKLFDLIKKTPRQRAKQVADSFKWAMDEGLLTEEQYNANLAALRNKLGELISNANELDEVGVYEQIFIAKETGLID